MKKKYMKPSMSIVQLQQQCQILAGSQPAVRGFTDDPESVVWDDDGLDDEDILR